ncbi:unnamed protein product [Aureobasidium vineae]|uniref:Uncharacterized protein n=1 Tax=Aureobasidium vineae TaxID=2773715 RepID=A0A9N8JM96_9PEZI|nr:unnamed protein product [Aureobasidium vineae]
MTSSFVDPTTVRPNFCRRSSSAANQQASFGDESVCCGNHQPHYQQQQYHQQQQHILQPSLEDSNVHFHWVSDDAQPKPWSTWPNTWYSQASPGANGSEHTVSDWNNSSISQSYMIFPLGNGNYVQTSQPTTDNWLLQRSYHGAQDVTDNQIPWTYNPVHPNYNDSHRHESQPHAHDIPHHESRADAQYSDPGDACFETAPVDLNHYTFVSPDEALSHEGYYPEKHDTGHWNWSQAAPNVLPLHPPLRTDIAIQDLGHLGGTSYFSKPSSSMVTPRTQISPTSSCWDVDDNASLATTNTTTPTDLVPDPPTEMVDPPSEDMNPSDKTM